MRMWMVDPSTMCDRHLLGEHVETHMFVGTMGQKTKLDGYVRNNLLEARSLISRHDELAEEMLARGMQHNSPIVLQKPIYDHYMAKIANLQVLSSSVDRRSALRDLHDRCPACRSRYNER